MMMDIPYFMTNKEWFYHDEKDFCYKLTDKAPPEAVKSYEKFYDDKINVDQDGEVQINDY